MIGQGAHCGIYSNYPTEFVLSLVIFCTVDVDYLVHQVTYILNLILITPMILLTHVSHRYFFYHLEFILHDTDNV